jgi:hypothetical protein
MTQNYKQGITQGASISKNYKKIENIEKNCFKIQNYNTNL